MAEEGAREKDERARRRARAERRREKKRAEASDMMRAMREEIEREESVRRLMVRVDSGEETEPTDIARAAAAAFERLERRYGKLSSLFAVLSWMNDFVDDEVDAAVGSEEEARARGEEGAVARDGSREPKRRASDDVPSGLLGSISNALREWFSIDITELEDGRKEVVVNASAEFLVLFVVLVVASSKFGGDLVAAVLTPDPLLR
ncbi:unnamed product [Ostreococcus tauri]|uniref:Unnamed product n=1 Tax=Ostreococcus tauri TaxID=70448 RepID=A0A090M9Z7_OSTTA|nr:unnamed product [Ostreococcus tauri]CEF99552.1 unnamed product [Ostreococcus tauri]|eukprot:XP_003081877.2 unnamed product [Ostreococcus tauri]